MDKIRPLTIDWKRSLLITSPIDDDLVRKLTPQIMALRQESCDPITIGIDSPGGSLASLETLLGLLTGPDQDKNTIPIITVATNRAYSAAANFLAFGNYAVALKHSQILYHDVRFGGLEDVTPERARDAAKSLQDANDKFALRLAQRIIKRLIWIYVDLTKDFETIKQNYSDLHKQYSSVFTSYAPNKEGYESVDLPSFALSLWARLSSENDALIRNVMIRLERWIKFTAIAKATPTYRQKGSRIPGLLDGVRHLHTQFRSDPDNFESYEEDFKLLLSLITSDLAVKKNDRLRFTTVLEYSMREFAILDSMNDKKHIQHASDLMLQNPYVFFKITSDDFKVITEENRAKILSGAEPHARLLWHFCVLLCRELFEGEHILKPNDAQLLGLVDEVSGGGPIQSKREFWIEQDKVATETPTD